MGRSIKDNKDIDYNQMRADCIAAFPSFYKDSLVFDFCKVDKPTQLRLLEDPVYITETKSARAQLFKENLETLDGVINGVYAEDGVEKSPTILKALEMKQKMLLDDVGMNDDLKSRLNIAFTQMSQEDFEKMGTVEVHEGTGNTDFSANFGVSSDNMSREEQAKAKLAESQLAEKQKAREAAEEELEDEDENEG